LSSLRNTLIFNGKIDFGRFEFNQMSLDNPKRQHLKFKTNTIFSILLVNIYFYDLLSKLNSTFYSIFVNLSI